VIAPATSAANAALQLIEELRRPLAGIDIARVISGELSAVSDAIAQSQADFRRLVEQMPPHALLLAQLAHFRRPNYRRAFASADELARRLPGQREGCKTEPND
jgi:uncharacterized lipoprotein